MAIIVLTVIVLILIAGYAAFFAVSNPQVIEVVTCVALNGQRYVEEVPVWALPVAGLLIGAILMAIALSGPWSTMRRTAALARQQLKAERDKSNKRAKKVNALSRRVKELEGASGDGSGSEEDASEEGLE